MSVDVVGHGLNSLTTFGFDRLQTCGNRGPLFIELLDFFGLVCPASEPRIDCNCTAMSRTPWSTTVGGMHLDSQTAAMGNAFAGVLDVTN